MPLTPEDVSKKRFTPVRLREGYDMGEVDRFLDEVESELARLTRENDELRSSLGLGQPDAGTSVLEPADAEPTQTTAPETTAPETTAPETTAPETTAPDKTVAPAAQPADAGPEETLKVTTVADASSAAVRLLEIATRNADELVGEARGEAERIVGDARTDAERLESETRERTDRVESDARTRSQMLDSETSERRSRLFGDLDREKEKLNNEVENLRSFEREYRARLKSYFNQQLAALDGSGEAGELPSDADRAPRRLKSLLGDDEDQHQG